MTFPPSFRLGCVLLFVVLSTILLTTVEVGAGDGAIGKKPGPAGYNQRCSVFATRFWWNNERCNEDLGLTCRGNCSCHHHQEFLPFCLKLERGRTKPVCQTRCVGAADYPCVETRTYNGLVMACVPNASCTNDQFCKCNPGFIAVNRLCHRIKPEDADLLSGYSPGSGIVHESLTGSGTRTGQLSRPLSAKFLSISACFPIALFLLLN